MATQFCPQLTHGGLPAAEHVAMPGRRHHLGSILGQVGPEQFHGLKLVGHAHLGEWEIHAHRQRASNPLLP